MTPTGRAGRRFFVAADWSLHIIVVKAYARGTEKRIRENRNPGPAHPTFCNSPVRWSATSNSKARVAGGDFALPGPQQLPALAGNRRLGSSCSSRPVAGFHAAHRSAV